MKGITLRLAALAILAIVLSPAVLADEADRGEAPQRGLHAKIEYCKICHGFSGQGYRGFFPYPAARGTTDRIFREPAAGLCRAQAGKPIHVCGGANPEPGNAIGAGRAFPGSQCRALGWGAKTPRRRGEETLRGGSSGNQRSGLHGLSRCGCQGRGRHSSSGRSAPRLHRQQAGELGPGAGQDLATPDPSAVMLPTSHNLTRSQIAAVAAYLSYQQ